MRMRLKRPLLALAAIWLAATAPAQAAGPFITVSPPGDGPNLAWWLLPMESNPTGRQVAGLTLGQINAALDETEARWCAADVLTPDAFSSPDPVLQTEIRDYLVSERITFETTTQMTGRELHAVVGNFRSCEGETAPFVLLTDQRAQVPQVVFVRMFTDWTPFIAMRREGQALMFGSCLECGHAQSLTYNRRTGGFAWRDDGM